MRIGRLGLATALAIWGANSPLAAQQPTPLPAPLPPRAEQPAPANTCDPLCRPGFLCREGQCISACNPPCPGGQRCSPNAQCVIDAPPAEAQAPAYQQPLYASPEPEPPMPRFLTGAERHDGFMLRFTLGFGAGISTIDPEASDTLKLTGASGTFGVDIGGALDENLVLHGRLASFQIVDPNLSVNGDDVGGTNDLTATAYLIGPAISYYFMPANVYITAAVGLSWLTLEYMGDQSDPTDVGIGLNFDVGKEWWVSYNWGLGIAARFWWSHMKDSSSGIDSNVTFTGVALLFSATYQ
jgi:hypothetical protein